MPQQLETIPLRTQVLTSSDVEPSQINSGSNKLPTSAQVDRYAYDNYLSFTNDKQLTDGQKSTILAKLGIIDATETSY